MKSKSLFIFLSLITIGVSAQDQTFFYSRSNGIIKLVNNSDTISLLNYVSGQDRTRERKVQMRGTSYLLSVSKKRDRTQKISDADGNLLCSVSLGTKNRYDIVLPDGKVLECSVKGRTWTYTLDAKEVIKSSLRKENGKKTIVVNTLDQEIVTPAVLLSSLERGTDRYVSAASTGPIIGVSLALALIRAATIDNSPDVYYP